MCRPGRPARSGRIAAQWRTLCCRAHSVDVSTHSLLSLSNLSHNLLEPQPSPVPSPLQQPCPVSSPLQQPCPVSTHTPFFLSHTPIRVHTRLFVLVPRPFWACLRSLGQSGQRTRLLPVNVTGGRSHRSPWRTLSAFKQTAFSRPRRCFHARRHLGGKSLRGSVAPPSLPEEIVFTRLVLVVGGGLMGGRCSELDDAVWSMMYGVVAMWRASKMASSLRCLRGSKMASLLR